MNTLTPILINCYNAPWPKKFNASAFIEPNEDMTPITRDTQIKAMDLEDKKSMASMLLEENQELRDTPFFNAFLFPIEQSLNSK